VLIEDGILKGYMQDRQICAADGRWPHPVMDRRQSYASPVMRAMTNTYMLAADKDPAEILGSVKKGHLRRNFGAARLDITNGKFRLFLPPRPI